MNLAEMKVHRAWSPFSFHLPSFNHLKSSCFQKKSIMRNVIFQSKSYHLSWFQSFVIFYFSIKFESQRGKKTSREVMSEILVLTLITAPVFVSEEERRENTSGTGVYCCSFDGNSAVLQLCVPILIDNLLKATRNFQLFKFARSSC